MATTNIEKNAQGIALILASVLMAGSTFYWQNGEYSVPAATLLITSIFFWIPAFMGLFGLIKRSMPRYAVYGLWVAVFGCVSGICFAFLGYLTAIFKMEHLTYLEKLSEHPFSSQLLLFASGPLFPLSVIVLGIVLARTKKLPSWQCILFSLAGIAFPVSRITRNQMVAHGADMLFLVACIFIAVHFFRRKASF